MEWLVILALVAWLWSERGRIQRLERRLDEIAQQLRAAGMTPAQVPPVAAAPFAEADVAARVSEPSPSPPPVSPSPLDEPQPAKPILRLPRTVDVSNWLAENGLAWLGGGALALGGLFLVVYATQRGFFTPPMRIGAAVLAGGLMLAASEWIRRQTRLAAHPLAAAAAAGAGGATLYGAIWSGQQLYHLIPFEMGAILIVLCSVGLLAYALLHGEALAVLALFGAFAAPVVTGVSDWRSPAPEAYLTAIIVTGFAFAALRRWHAAGFATIAGALLWSAASLIEGEPLKAALLLLAAVAGACLAVGWRVRRDGPQEAAAFERQPLIAILSASVLAILLWWSSFAEPQAWIAVLTVAALCAMAAAALVRGLTPAYAVAAPVAAAILGLLLAHSVDVSLTPSLTPLAVAPVLIAVSGWAASFWLTGRDRLIALAASGLGAAVLATLSRFVIDGPHVDFAWAASAATSAVMFAAAWPLAARSQDAGADRGLALWLAGAAELALIGVAGGIQTPWEPAAHALAGGLLAAAALRLRWMGLAQAAVAAALVAFAVMLRPSFMGEAIGSEMPMAFLLATSLTAVAITFAAGFVLNRSTSRTEGEALKTASLLISLFAAFLVIQRLLTTPGTGEVGHHLAASLRTVLLLTATLLLAIRARADDGWLSRWRLRILLVAGLAHGLLLQSLVLSPLWSIGEPPLGVPVLNTLLASYLAPALLLAALYRRKVHGSPAWTRTVAVGAFLFGLLWCGLCLRHAFHPGEAMSSAPIARNEGCAYAVLLLVAACALIRVRRGRTDGSDWLAQAAQPTAWVALSVAAVVFWFLASPWWGVPGASMSVASVLLLFVLYGLSAAVAGSMHRQAAGENGAGWPRLAQVSLVAAVGSVFALATLMVRFAFHGGDMGPQVASTALETWAYSAIWALFGLGALIAGGLRRSYTLRWIGLGVLLVTVAKVLLFDTSRLDGMIRAASFLALGILLIIGALAARRLNARALLFAGKG